MRRFLLLAAAGAALSFAAAAHADPVRATAEGLRDKALAGSGAWEIVESLTTEIGGRPTGSPAMERAKDWGVAKLKALGFENVHVEPFVKQNAWLRGPESASVTLPYPHKLSILGLGNSVATPAAGIEAEIVVFDSLNDMLAAPAGSLSGKIAVVNQPMVRTQTGEGYGAAVRARSGASEAARRGAVAYLTRSISTGDSNQPHTGAMQYADGVAKIPTAALGVPDADLLARLYKRGKPVKVKLNLASTVIAQAPAWNIVGEIKGREKPDEVIVIGGHLDSWDPGTGAIDDASGIAITTAAAKLIGDLPQRPRRTIRVVMWGSEETGGAGEAYAEAHKNEVAKMVLAGESDLGGGRLFKVDLPKGAAADPAMAALPSILAPLKIVVTREAARFAGSDVEGLEALGVPVASLYNDASRYFDLHHSADDTLDKVDRGDLDQNVAAWAALLYLAAESDIDFRNPRAAAKK